MFGRDKPKAPDSPPTPAPVLAPVIPAKIPAPVPPTHQAVSVPPARPVTPPPLASESIIAPRTFMRGTLTFERKVRIEGHFEGKLLTKGEVVVAQTGRVVGDIAAKSVTVEGIVLGNIHASDRAVLGSRAMVAGDIRSKHLVVAEGAKMGGSVDIDSAFISSVIRCDTHPSHSAKGLPGNGQKLENEPLDLATLAQEMEDSSTETRSRPAEKDLPLQEDIRIPEDYIDESESPGEAP